VDVSRPGCFITLEGGEGAGKSTQARRLAEWLEARGIGVLVTREPGGSPRAEVLRDLLLTGAVAPFGAEAEALVFAIARWDHLATTIRPALESGAWVISDRFLDSTWAYQGAAGVSRERLAELDAVAVGATLPDLTIILDQPAEMGLRRIAQGRASLDRFEADSLELQEARRQAFLRIAIEHPERCIVVEADQDECAVAGAIREVVRRRLLPTPYEVP
jgi:dTMP kinase